MAILATWAIIAGIALMVWGGYVYSYSKLVRHENMKLKDRLSHAETELENIKSKIDWGNF